MKLIELLADAARQFSISDKIGGIRTNDVDLDMIWAASSNKYDVAIK